MKTSTSAPDFKLIKKIKDESFDVEELHHYALSIQIGTKDFQFCVVDRRINKCLIVEDFVFEGLRTVRDRLEVVQRIFESHHLLMAGFWNAVRISFKTHKFTLVPSSHFNSENVPDYLMVNSEVNHKLEDIYYYRHLKSSAINVFAADKKVINWIDNVYTSKSIQVIHQGSALVEGILSYDDHTHEKMMFIFMDKGLIHVIVTHQLRLLYYNQFAVKISNDFLKYVMLVFKEHQLSQKQTRVTVWGNANAQSPHLLLLKKYIKNIQFGKRPPNLNLNYQFDEIAEHQYFDLLNIHLCD